MITKIGIVAGEIWQLLESDGKISLKDINSRLDSPDHIVFMSLGWLSREGHILLEKEGDDFIVTLRKKEAEGIKK